MVSIATQCVALANLFADRFDSARSYSRPGQGVPDLYKPEYYRKEVKYQRLVQLSFLDVLASPTQRNLEAHWLFLRDIRIGGFLPRLHPGTADQTPPPPRRDLRLEQELSKLSRTTLAARSLPEFEHSIECARGTFV